MIKEDLVYELVISDESDEVYAVSLVNSPAIELGWVAFDKEEVKFQKIDEEKQLVLGPILIPNKRILRVDGEGNTYHVFLKPETIEQLAQKYLKNKYVDAVTVEHEKRVDDVVLVESWIVESSTKDKSSLYGFAVPKGTWMGVMKINSDKIWEDVKNGTYQGFSIEGLFSHQLVAAAKVEIDMMDKEVSELTEEESEVLLKKIKAVISKDKRYKKKQRIDLESYSDYPEAVKNNAKRALEWADKNGWGSCGTAVGKIRSNQLAKGEPISVDTIKRIYSYVSRHEIDLQTSKTYSDGCGKLMMDSWGGLAAGRWAKSKLKELGLITENEAQPSIPGSSYAGEPASGSIAPALLGDVPPVLQDFEECPEATQNVALNLFNRHTAIQTAKYGPFDIKNPGDYWKEIASEWGVDEETARGEVCGNCAAFVVTQKMLDCIAEGLSSEDAWDVIEAGDLGYCTIFSFKCNGNRSCLAHIDGGPVKD
jgi:hypothetical protein